MPKFYVESGKLRKVVDATDELGACLKCVRMVRLENTGKMLRVDREFVVSEKGFVCDRNPLEVDTNHDIFISTIDVMKRSR